LLASPRLHRYIVNMGSEFDNRSSESTTNLRKSLITYWKSHSVLRFVITFLAFLVLGGIVFSQLLSRFHEQVLWLMDLTASIVGLAMSLFSSNVSFSGATVIFNGFSVEIIDECTGLFEMLIYVAAVLAYSASIKKKLLGIALGVPAIFIFNIVRIAVLLIAGASSLRLFDFMHLYFWQATLIIMIATAWVGWLYLVVYREKKTIPVSA
jgi:archaeosortase B (VPXXXP-CTERM-specific)